MAQSTQTASLDLTGTQAAFYPDEDTLWTYGPPAGPLVTEDPAPGAPAQINQAAADTYLHESINGELTNEAYYQEWVNPLNIGPTGVGDWSSAPWQTGHTQNILSNPASEQGWGVGPARRWARFPFNELPNPYRNSQTDQRDGQSPYQLSRQTELYWRTGLEYEALWGPLTQVPVHSAVVPLAPSVPFTQTVPTYGGGPLPIPGIDIPIGNEGYYGYYTDPNA